MFEQVKVRPQIAYEIEEDGSMAGLVAQNFGIAVMPEIPVLNSLRWMWSRCGISTRKGTSTWRAEKTNISLLLYQNLRIM